ncbi:MAG: phosphoribosylaminoimidazolesuccinocarboxamide synthase [Lachnospiraceae bacterium]|nr:phosphoribosylaminoimidazolesuccinocarboxamide synthase [Lachnospiraceae bacterium]
MQEYAPVKQGKVREIYDVGDNLVIVATDRISCFDVILDNEITNKGKVLTQMSEFWFDFTKDIVPNHMISTDTADMPEFFRNEKFEGRSMLVRKLNMLPVECIVRGYITGTAWKEYVKSQTVCKTPVVAGLVESQKFPEAIFTPSTKAEIGDHDENVSYDECIDYLEARFPGKGREYASKIRDYSLAIYNKCADYARGRGIIIADTKFEFGLDEDGNIVLADEVLTPDSSRFWPADKYESGRSQESFDKQYARDWLTNNKDHSWHLPEDVTKVTIDKYISGFKMLTGRELR